MLVQALEGVDWKGGYKLCDDMSRRGVLAENYDFCRQCCSRRVLNRLDYCVVMRPFPWSGMPLLLDP
jgi:hypothetical protein